MKKKPDLNQLAKSIVEQATDEAAPTKEPEKKKTLKKSCWIIAKRKIENYDFFLNFACSMNLLKSDLNSFS